MERRRPDRTEEVGMRFADFDINVFDVHHLELVDHARNHDKFYRAYHNRSTNEVFFQYGRNHTGGTFTPHRAFRTHSEALKYMNKQLASKEMKGYNFITSMSLEFSENPPKARLHYQVENELQLAHLRF
jgi:predicted DNA-binding WGR domain protein